MTAPDGWTETSGILQTSGSVVLAADGTGVITLDPDHANQRWEVTNVDVSTNQPGTATTIPVVTIALDTVTVATLASYNQRGSTWSGNQDQWAGGTIDVGPCNYLSICFAPVPGQPGAAAALAGVIAKARISGTKYTRRA